MLSQIAFGQQILRAESPYSVEVNTGAECPVVHMDECCGNCFSSVVGWAQISRKRSRSLASHRFTKFEGQTALCFYRAAFIVKMQCKQRLLALRFGDSLLVVAQFFTLSAGFAAARF